METPSAKTGTELPEAQIADLLLDQYGNGRVYLDKRRFNRLYTLAMEHGYIDAKGYLTRKGRTLMVRYQYTTPTN